MKIAIRFCKFSEIKPGGTFVWNNELCMRMEQQDTCNAVQLSGGQQLLFVETSEVIPKDITVFI